ncbi:MAG: hypothetical protein HKM24_04060 [Gammaproteobacteria bacterium]|nr:hypothetical protein [Gammaproteobacteria bacterium]
MSTLSEGLDAAVAAGKLSTERKRQLEQLAQELGRPVQDVVAEIIDKGLDDYSKIQLVGHQLEKTPDTFTLDEIQESLTKE